MKRNVVLIVALVISFFVFTDTVHSAKGDFYNEYKDIIDDRLKHHPELIKIIKKYDYNANEFDCGWIDFHCKIHGTFMKWTLGMIKAAISLGDSAVVSPTDVTQNSIFLYYKDTLSTVSIWALAIFLMWQIVKITAMRFADADDGMIAMNQQILKVIALSIFLGMYTEIFEYILTWQAELTGAILKDPVDPKELTLTAFLYSGFYGLIITLIIIGVMMIFKIAFLYRFVLFGFLYITGVIAIPTGMNDEYNYFSIWLRILITNGVTLFLQALAYTLGLNALLVQDAFNRGTSFTTAMALFVLALMIPSLLGQYGASTGTARGVGTVARVATRVISRR